MKKKIAFIGKDIPKRKMKKKEKLSVEEMQKKIIEKYQKKCYCKELKQGKLIHEPSFQKGENLGFYLGKKSGAEQILELIEKEIERRGGMSNRVQIYTIRDLIKQKILDWEKDGTTRNN